MRLCVETVNQALTATVERAAAFVRLCVETHRRCLAIQRGWQPPSCGCVLKRKISLLALLLPVAAAFVRLCVETIARITNGNGLL